MTYLEIVNHENFRTASRLIERARIYLKDMGLTQDQSYDWIKAWASGAGDPEGDEE